MPSDFEITALIEELNDPKISTLESSNYGALINWQRNSRTTKKPIG